VSSVNIYVEDGIVYIKMQDGEVIECFKTLKGIPLSAESLIVCMVKELKILNSKIDKLTKEKNESST